LCQTVAIAPKVDQKWISGFYAAAVGGFFFAGMKDMRVLVRYFTRNLPLWLSNGEQGGMLHDKQHISAQYPLW
jgi:hypothetical protein